MGLRKGLNSDLKYIFDIETKVYDKPYWNKKMLDEVLSGKTENRIWVYELNRIIIGFIIDLRYDNEVNILNIAIGKPFQNKGHGLKMLYIYLKSLPRECIVLLEVKKNNYKALKIYYKLNFQKLNTRKAYYNDGTDAVNMILVK